MKISRKDYIEIIIKACKDSSDNFGKFKRRNVFSLMPNKDFKSPRFYGLFKDLINSGDIIPVADGIYRLNEAFSKASDRISRAAEEKQLIKTESMLSLCKDVIEYLNLKAGTGYKHSGKKTQSLIQARFNEGFKKDDFFIVIDKKCNEWLGTKMAVFLRPETLFSNKFEGYRNQLKGETKMEQMQNMNFDLYFKDLK